MRLSTKGRYAVMAMVDLAAHGEDRAVSLAEIAGRQQISLPYLEQLFARLRAGGLIKSVRGPGGGYVLARPSNEITIADICLAGQAAGSTYFKVDIAPFPTVKRIADLCMQNDAFARAHPMKQPGAPASV